MARQVAVIDGRPDARAGRADRPVRAVAAATRNRTAPASSVPRGVSTATSTPPMANPQICIVPSDMFMTDRPSRKPPGGRISFSSPNRTPPSRDVSTPSTKRIANSQPIGIPGIACAAVPAPISATSHVRAPRGGSRSAADISSVAPSTCARAGPNMLSADSNGEPVAVNTSVPSARPLTVVPAMDSVREANSGAYSGVRNSSR